MQNKDMLLKSQSENPGFIADLTCEELTNWAESGAFSGLTPEAFSAIAIASPHTINYLAYAAANGHPEALNQLVASNAFSALTPEAFSDIASEMFHTIESLAYIASNGHPEALNQLAASGALALTPEDFAYIVRIAEDTVNNLADAASKGHPEALQQLIQTGAITLSSLPIDWAPIDWPSIFTESLESDANKGLALLNAAYHQGYNVGEICDNHSTLVELGVEKTIQIANYRRQKSWVTPASNPVVEEDDLRNIHLSIIPRQLLLAKVLLGRSIPSEIAMKVAQMCRFQRYATLDTPTFTQYFQETFPLHHIAHSIEVVAAGVVQQLYFSIPYIKYKAVTQYRKILFTALKAFLRGINELDSKTDNLGWSETLLTSRID